MKRSLLFLQMSLIMVMFSFCSLVSADVLPEAPVVVSGKASHTLSFPYISSFTNKSHSAITDLDIEINTYIVDYADDFDDIELDAYQLSSGTPRADLLADAIIVPLKPSEEMFYDFYVRHDESFTGYIVAKVKASFILDNGEHVERMENVWVMPESALSAFHISYDGSDLSVTISPADEMDL